MDQVVDLLRGVVLFSGALAAAGTVLAVFALQRHRGARIGLSVVAVLMLFSATFVSGILPVLVAVAAIDAVGPRGAGLVRRARAAARRRARRRRPTGSAAIRRLADPPPTQPPPPPLTRLVNRPGPEARPGPAGQPFGVAPAATVHQPQLVGYPAHPGPARPQPTRPDRGHRRGLADLGVLRPASCCSSR